MARSAFFVPMGSGHVNPMLGPALDPERLDADTLWQAVDRVAEEAEERERLEWTRGRIAEAGGATAAADTVEEALERG